MNNKKSNFARSVSEEVSRHFEFKVKSPRSRSATDTKRIFNWLPDSDGAAGPNPHEDMTGPRNINIEDVEGLQIPENFVDLDKSLTALDWAEAMKSRIAIMAREKKAYEPDPECPLEKVVVYVDPAHEQKEIIETIIKRLGGEVYSNYDIMMLTHVICSNGSESAWYREHAQSAYENEIMVVDGGWILACDSEQLRVDESNYKIEVFGRCRFALAPSLSDDERQRATTLIRKHGGVMATEMEQVTHFVAPLVTPTQVVTVCYLEACAKSHTMLERTADFLFEPVPIAVAADVAPQSGPLAGAVLAFSGFSIDKRPALKSVARALGAVVQDQMVRKPFPSRALLATTHLVIGQPEGSKLPSARAWGIPAVSKHWLGACAVAGRLVSTDKYVIAHVDPVVRGRYQWLNDL